MRLKHLLGIVHFLSFFHEFENLNYFLKRKKPYNPIGRNQTKDEAIHLDDKIKHMLANHDIEFDEINGDFSAINIITEQVLEKMFGRELKYKIII